MSLSRLEVLIIFSLADLAAFGDLIRYSGLAIAEQSLGAGGARIVTFLIAQVGSRLLS